MLEGVKRKLVEKQWIF